ncbi:putative transport domain protein, partial [Vibrio parahaemolyticus VP2007-007]
EQGIIADGASDRNMAQRYVCANGL